MDGNEKFFNGEKELDFQIIDFWKWYASNLLHGPLRGALAEFIVAKALGLPCDERNIFAPVDLEYNGLRIEVKSSAYLQQKKTLHLTNRVAFDISEHTHNGIMQRHSDFYIFCVYNNTDMVNYNALQVQDWTFYILPTSRINYELKTKKAISLNVLQKMNPVVANYDNLKMKIDMQINIDAEEVFRVVVKDMNSEQFRFIEKELRISKVELLNMSEEEISAKVYDVLCDIEVEETLSSGDNDLTYRGKMADELVTLFGIAIKNKYKYED